MEAMIISFVCEKWLSVPVTGDIVTLKWELTTDTKTLLKVKLKRTATQYKLQFGLAKTWKRVCSAKEYATYFWLNLDEATSSNHHKSTCSLSILF